MKWENLKIFRHGLTACRLGAAGFLLFFSLLGLSAQQSSLPSIPDEPIQLSKPETPAPKPGATLTDKLVQQLEAWVNWWEKIWTPWNETDKHWHETVKASLTQAAILLQKQSERADKAESEAIALRLENENLKQKVKTLQYESWLFGLAGAGAGVGIAGILYAVSDKIK